MCCMLCREELQVRMANLESQVIHQGSASLDASPERPRPDTASSQDHAAVQQVSDDDSTSEAAGIAEHAALQESLQQLQQQLALKDLILDSLEDLLPSGHVEQVGRLLQCC